MIVGEAVALEPREPREPCDWGDSRPVGKGYSVGSSSTTLALPLLDLDPALSTSSSVSSTDDSDVEVDMPDANVDDEPNESDPDELDASSKAGLRDA